MVQEGRGHAAIDVWAIGEAPLWSVSLFCGAGGDRAPSRSGLLHAGGCSSARAGGIDNLPRAAARNAATRSGGLEYRATTAQWHAERAARRPKRAKLARNAALRTLCRGTVGWRRRGSERGLLFPARSWSWKNRRHGPRKDRRWSKAPGARSRSPVACRWTSSRTTRPCASAMKPSIKRCSFKVEARCAAN